MGLRNPLNRSISWKDPDQQNGGGDVALLDPIQPAANRNNPAELIAEVGSCTQRVNELLRREREHQHVTREEWEKVQKAEEEILLRITNLQAVANAKANASIFGGGASEELVIQRAAMRLKLPDDLRSMDSGSKDLAVIQYNLMALSPDELTGLCQLGEMDIPGLNPGVRQMVADRRNAPIVRNIERAQQLNNRLVWKDALMFGRGNTRYARAYGSTYERMRTLREWPEYERIMLELHRAVNETTTTAGGFLVPVILASSVQQKMELALRVAGLFGRFPMPSNVFQWPLLGTHLKAFTIPEMTPDHTTYPPGDNTAAGAILASTPVWARPTWTARKLGVLVFSSNDIDEDSATAVLPFLENDTAMALAHSVDEALINGERAANTMDGAVFNPTTETAATAGRQLFNGLRFYALMTGSYPAQVDAGNLAITDTMEINLQQLMGVWGVTPSQFAWVTGFRGYHGMRKQANYQTLDKIGPRAVLLTGTIGEVLGSPVILSEKVLDNNAAGKFDGITTNRGTVLGVNTARGLIGDKRAVTVDSSEHVAFRSDQVAIRGTQRLDFEFIDTPAATITPVGIIFNIL